MVADTTEEREDGFVAVATVDEIPQGRGIGVDIGGIELSIFHVNDEFYAISNRCAHQQAPLSKAGEKKINAEHTWTDSRGSVNEDECTVSCPWHLWEWDLETGVHEASGKRIGTFDCKRDGDDVLVRI